VSHRKPPRHSLDFDCLEGKLLLSTYYVATTGSDTAAGTATAPWAAIQQAAQEVKPGDTVIVEPGKYTIAAEGINTATSGTAGAPITFISATKLGAQLYNPGGITQEQVWNNTGDYVTIQGFDMSGNGANGVWAGINNTGSYCQFIGNYIHDIAVPSGMTTGGTGGIGTWQVDALGGHNTIVGNFITRIGTPGGGNLWHGIYEEGPYAYIANNICAYNMSCGITNGYYSHNDQIINNLCIGNGIAGIYIGGDGPVLEDYSIIANNICVDNGYYGIMEPSDSTVGIHEQYIDNCVYGNPDGGIIQQSGDLYPATGTVSADPQFVNYQIDGTGDYHLTASSPCIGTGTSIDMPAMDFDGVTRPSDGPYDIGPYQYISTPTPIPLIGDSGFEQVVVGAGQFKYDPTGSPWAFSGSSGISGNNSGFTSGSPPAPQGSQVAFVQATGSFTRTVADWAAGSYVLTFDAAQRENVQASQENFSVLIDGTVVDIFTPSSTSYQSYSTAMFTVTAGTHTITFQGLDSAGGDNTAFIDDVSIS